MRRARTQARGFSLIEVLLAVAVSAMLLAGVSMWLLSLANIWLNQGSDDHFQQHVEGMSVFLNNTIAMSEGFEEQGGETGQPVQWQKPPGASEFDDPLLSFTLKEAPPLLVASGDALPGLTCYLSHDKDEGLFILWHSRLQDTEEDEEVFRTPVSKYVKRVEYCYYDREDDSWEILEEPKEEDEVFLVPNFLKLACRYADDGEELEKAIAIFIPQRSANVPLY